MWYLIIIISVIWIGVFIWARMDYKKRRVVNNKSKDKPAFRSEEDLEEYGKPMEPKPVDFEDAE